LKVDFHSGAETLSFLDDAVEISGLFSQFFNVVGHGKWDFKGM